VLTAPRAIRKPSNNDGMRVEPQFKPFYGLLRAVISHSRARDGKGIARLL